MDWDNLKIFLAIARSGSVRSAANQLKINQSTVSRRITAFEKSLGSDLFVKLPSGYLITPAGEQILANVERIESEVFSIDRLLFNQQPELSGSLKIALPVPLANHMLMSDMARFAKKYPGIRLDLIISGSVANLSKRETDVAIRIIKIGDTPPPYLIGRKLVTYAEATYVARAEKDHNKSWLGHCETEIQPQWLKQSDFPEVNITHSVDNLMTRMQAVKAGLGMGIFPCCFGDLDPDLVRVTPSKLLPGKEIWLLTHVDLKNTPRVRVFLDFIREVFEQKKGLLEGKYMSE